MGKNKVDFINAKGATETLIDLTSDTVTAETLAKGVTAHGANGELITGTLVVGGALETCDVSVILGSSTGTGAVALPQMRNLSAIGKFTLYIHYMQQNSDGDLQIASSTLTSLSTVTISALKDSLLEISSTTSIASISCSSSISQLAGDSTYRSSFSIGASGEIKILF